MKNFKKKNLFELRKLLQEELEVYYKDLRKFNYENNKSLKRIELRKKIHQLLLLIVKIDRLINKDKIVILSDKRIQTNKPKIYACTHIGGKDIERSFEAIKDSCYLLLGDPKEVYRSFSGLLLYLNGVICLETRDKQDRKIAKDRAIELLNKGGNLLIYPEGAWNITENLPVMKLFTGAVDMAITTNAEIIPIAMEQYDNTFYFTIGENINYEGKNIDDKYQLTKDLRDILCSLKWDIWEKFEKIEREQIDNEYKTNFAQSIVDKCELGYTIQDVLDTRFKDKNIVEYEEVFSFEKKLIPSMNNAFLYRKK